ncbi:hypothetical protein IWW34DRAFT_825318 [Fusarium oxysporum f. sp. albedinis]|nr:hypothetical protein IWW34DRAFT_825318 [Fusarium oxysporum f. sp. albedinis]
MDTRSLDKVTQDDPQVHTESYDSQIECLKDIISGLKAEIERHDKECNLTRQQEIERLRKKQDELWKATKDLGELRQFLSTVKTEIDSMHRMMPAPEQAAYEQGEMAKLRESISLLEARMEGVLDEAAESQTENKRLKDELGKARSENLSLEAKLKDEGHQLNSQLADLIMKVNKNSEVLNLFSDHCKSDVSQVKVLHGRLEAFHMLYLTRVKRGGLQKRSDVLLNRVY